MKSRLLQSIADKIREIREDHSLTQTDIARLTGLSEATISRYANQNVDPKAGMFSLLLLLGLAYLYQELSAETKRKVRTEIKGITGKQLKLMRVDMEFTQLQLSEYLGVSTAAISRWEKGIVKIEHLPIIAFAMSQLKFELSGTKKAATDVIASLETVAA